MPRNANRTGPGVVRYCGDRLYRYMPPTHRTETHGPCRLHGQASTYNLYLLSTSRHYTLLYLTTSLRDQVTSRVGRLLFATSRTHLSAVADPVESISTRYLPICLLINDRRHRPAFGSAARTRRACRDLLLNTSPRPLRDALPAAGCRLGPVPPRLSNGRAQCMLSGGSCMQRCFPGPHRSSQKGRDASYPITGAFRRRFASPPASLSLSPVSQLLCFSEPLFTMPLAGSRTVTSPPPCSLLKTFFQLPDGGPLQYYCMPTNTSGDQGLCDKLPLSTGVWPSRPCRSRVAGQDSSIHRWC